MRIKSNCPMAEPHRATWDNPANEALSLAIRDAIEGRFSRSEIIKLNTKAQ
jgi:hypothetical protein